MDKEWGVHGGREPKEPIKTHKLLSFVSWAPFLPIKSLFLLILFYYLSVREGSPAIDKNLMLYLLGFPLLYTPSTPPLAPSPPKKPIKI